MKQLRDALHPIRVGDYDQRPFKTISLDNRRGRPQAAHVVVVAHVAAAHTRHYRDTLQPMTGSPRDRRMYRSID